MGNCLSADSDNQVPVIRKHHRNPKETEVSQVSLGPSVKEDELDLAPPETSGGDGGCRDSFQLDFVRQQQRSEGLGSLQCRFSSLANAQRHASTKQRPLLVLDFVGDASTDKLFSHPLLVEAAESLFVVVRLPHDEKTTGKGSIRVMNENEAVEQVAEKFFSLASLCSTMVRGLQVCQCAVPVYLQLLLEEETGRRRGERRVDREATFGMLDSQVGEVEFGGLDGVLATRSGHIGRQPVVQVTYDSTKLSYCNLVRYALQQNVADTVYFQSNDEKTGARMELQRVDSGAELVSFLGITIQPSVDAKRALRQTMLRFVPLTDLQSTRANRLVHRGVFNEAMRLLSPRQGTILMRSMQAKGLQEVIDVPIGRAWLRLSGGEEASNCT